jgi:hypothetical protein
MEHPFTCMVAGPTKAGKTMFVKRLVENMPNVISPRIEKIWWCYSEDQPLYKNIRHKITFVKGIPDFNEIKSFSPTPQLLIIDDLMHEMKGNTNLMRLFTRGCHHWGISVIHIVQNIFYDGLRTSRINTDYLVLFKNPADQLQAQILGRFIFPTKQKYFSEAYMDATKPAHGYLFIDLTQKTEAIYRLKTDIFSPTPTFYVPNL